MASKVIYPPIVNSYMPAFVVKKVENTDDPDNIGWDGACKVYFSLSKFNSRSDFKSVHVSIAKQGSGVSVVNKENNAPRYRATGIILNVEAKPVLKEGSTEELFVEPFPSGVKFSNSSEEETVFEQAFTKSKMLSKERKTKMLFFLIKTSEQLIK